MVKLREVGASSQNRLGRETAMDIATIKGVVDRLLARGLIKTSQDLEDGRRVAIRLTDAGARAVEKGVGGWGVGGPPPPHPRQPGPNAPRPLNQ